MSQGLGNSYNGNIINGIIGGGAAIVLTPYVLTNNPPSVMMNVFYDDIVTGAAVGFQWDAPILEQNGPAILFNSQFFSNGSNDSQGIYLENPDNQPLIQDSSFQGFWS